MVRKLKNSEQIRQALAYLWRMVDENKMDTVKARTLIYLCATLKSVIETGDIEKRIEALEEANKK